MLKTKATSRQVKCRTFLFCAPLAMGLGIQRAQAQQQSTPEPPSVGPQAASIVLKHYAINPTALDPKTQQPLPNSGNWLIGKTTPAACPPVNERCVEVFYEVPAESVRCSWVVLLNADGTDGKLLDENDDAERYMQLTVTKGEAKDLVVTRKKPVFARMAIALQASGSVVVKVQVDKTGDVEKTGVISGPPVLQPAAVDAAKSWKFKPMLVGTRAVPYETQLVFTFRTMNPSWGIVEVAP
jgi:TonB family protein